MAALVILSLLADVTPRISGVKVGEFHPPSLQALSDRSVVLKFQAQALYRSGTTRQLSYCRPCHLKSSGRHDSEETGQKEDFNPQVHRLYVCDPIRYQPLFPTRRKSALEPTSPLLRPCGSASSTLSSLRRAQLRRVPTAALQPSKSFSAAAHWWHALCGAGNPSEPRSTRCNDRETGGSSTQGPLLASSAARARGGASLSRAAERTSGNERCMPAKAKQAGATQ